MVEASGIGIRTPRPQTRVTRSQRSLPASQRRAAKVNPTMSTAAPPSSSMGAAANWMAEHGVPPPARGIRNTGEQAMLVLPAHACGVYIGFVGPA
jgi:hypothetical protein